MKIQSARFGSCEIEDRLLLRFVGPILGFDGSERFGLIEKPEHAPLHWLQSLDDPQLCLPLIEPLLVKSDYEVDVASADAQALQLSRAEDACVLCVVVLSHHVEGLRVNLRAPIIWNVTNGLAKQIVLNEADCPIRYRFSAAPATGAAPESTKAVVAKEVAHACA